MNWPLMAKIVWGIVGLLFVCSAAWMQWSYLTYPEKGLAVITDTHDKVYRQLRSEWVRPSVADIRQGIDAEPVDQFDLMTYRAALGRWRLRHVAPNAYLRLEEAYERRLWTGAWKEQLRAEFEELDKKWLRAREMAIVRDDKPTTPILEARPRGLRMRFGEGTRTSQLGSVLAIDFVAIQVPIRKAPAIAIWGTRKFPEASPSRIRACTVEKTARRSGARPVYRMTMDMSDEPFWLDPECEPVWITFDGDGSRSWRPLDFQFYDSEHLQVSIERDVFAP